MAATPRPQLVSVHGEPSWRFASDRVEAFLTRAGGHVGPVTFDTPAGPIQPFSIAPWGGEPQPTASPDVLRMLRGDFFCAPFGGNGTPWRGEQHPVHGETAGRPWTLRTSAAKNSASELTAELSPSVRPGRVIKRLSLRAGETNLYNRHELHEFSGPMCIGHHAMLAFPDEPGSGRIAISPWHQGYVCPQPLENAAQGGYSSLKTGASFKTLRQVPLAIGGNTDLSAYPARDGFEDLVMVSARKTAGNLTPLAWTAVTFPKQRYVWFALKDPRVLASTIIWHSNGGRHYPPWNGRHRRVLGLEETTSYFHFGLAESAASNPLSRSGVPTVVQLDPKRPLIVNYVMGVAAVPRDFDTVKTILFRNGHIVLRSASGVRVEHAIDLTFLNPVP